MPELPEVQTVVDGLNLKVRGRKIVDVWTDYFLTKRESVKEMKCNEISFTDRVSDKNISLYFSENYKNAENIKSKKYFQKFKKEIIGTKILKAERRAKNIIIHLDNKNFLLIHLKMSGHLIYGDYKYFKKGNY